MTDNHRSKHIDWTGLVESLALNNCGSDAALRAIEEIIGVDAIRASVDYYVSSHTSNYVSKQPGAELARSVLWQLHPWSAMQRCREIYDHSDDIHARRSAIELLRVVANARAVPWIEDFMRDPDESIQNCVTGIVDQLLWSHLIDPESLRDLSAKMAVHPNKNVRSAHEIVEYYLKSDDDSASV